MHACARGVTERAKKRERERESKREREQERERESKKERNRESAREGGGGRKAERQTSRLRAMLCCKLLRASAFASVANTDRAPAHMAAASDGRPHLLH